MVGIRGVRTEDGIRVEQIAEIDAQRIPRPPLDALVEGQRDFAFQLLTHLVASGTAGADRNLAVSPHSVATSLAMALEGARGETATGMARTLGVSGVDRSLLSATYADLLRILHANPRADWRGKPPVG